MSKITMQLEIKLNERQFTKLMAALDDLKAAIVNLNTSVSNEIKAVSDKLASLGSSVSEADVESAVTSLNQTAATLDTETKTLTGS